MVGSGRNTDVFIILGQIYGEPFFTLTLTAFAADTTQVLAVFVRSCANTFICVAGLWRIPHVAEPRVDSHRSYGHNVTYDLTYARQHVATILLTTTASNDAHNQRTDTIMVAHTLRSTALAAIAIGMAAAAS